MSNFNVPVIHQQAPLFNELTFSGADIVAQVTVPVLTNDGINTPYTVTKPITIANIQTMSISTHRDKVPVRAFGKVNVRGFTRGPRTIGGSLVFVSLDRDSLYEVQNAVRLYYMQANKNYSSAYSNAVYSTLIPALAPDELPPFDITITMMNEVGNLAATAKILGVEIVDNGQVMGIDDLYIEQTMSYIATDYYPIYPMLPGLATPSPNSGQSA